MNMNIRDIIMNSPPGWLHRMAYQAVLAHHGVYVGLLCDWDRVRERLRELTRQQL